MDAATAAAMSDPMRNPAFRRRWHEQQFLPEGPSPLQDAAPESIGPIGLALLDAWRRERAQRRPASQPCPSRQAGR